MYCLLALYCTWIIRTYSVNWWRRKRELVNLRCSRWQSQQSPFWLQDFSVFPAIRNNPWRMLTNINSKYPIYFWSFTEMGRSLTEKSIVMWKIITGISYYKSSTTYWAERQPAKVYNVHVYQLSICKINIFIQFHNTGISQIGYCWQHAENRASHALRKKCF